MHVQYRLDEGAVSLTHDGVDDTIEVEVNGSVRWLIGVEVDEFMKAVEEIRIRRIKRDDSLVNKIGILPNVIQPCITVNNA